MLIADWIENRITFNIHEEFNFSVIHLTTNLWRARKSSPTKVKLGFQDWMSERVIDLLRQEIETG